MPYRHWLNLCIMQINKRKYIIWKGLPLVKELVAINICGIIIAKQPVGDTLLAHEYIHTQQMKEMLYVFFYLWYVLEWLVRLTITHDFLQAYRQISFEQEAYKYQYISDYSKKRKHYAWIKCMHTW